MAETGLWGYNDIYGAGTLTPDLPKNEEMREALNYLCARVRRSGDFWNALRTASAMYGVDLGELRIHFERRKRAGIAKYRTQKKEREKWFAFRCTAEAASVPCWKFVRATDGDKARLSLRRGKDGRDCTISAEAPSGFATREEAGRYASAWEKEHAVHQPELPGFTRS